MATLAFIGRVLFAETGDWMSGLFGPQHESRRPSMSYRRLYSHLHHKILSNTQFVSKFTHQALPLR